MREIKITLKLDEKQMPYIEYDPPLTDILKRLEIGQEIFIHILSLEETIHAEK
jgi:hypothetical protein